MGCEIVMRNVDNFPRQAGAEGTLHQRPFDGCWMIEIDPGAARGSQVGTVAVKIVEGEAAGGSAEGCLQLFCEVRFSGAAAADDCNKDWAHPAVGRDQAAARVRCSAATCSNIVSNPLM